MIEIRICLTCNKEFKVRSKRTTKYCCNLCKYKGMIGRKVSKETSKKISNSNRGRVSWNKGLTKDTDKRIAKNAKSTSRANKGITLEQRHGKEKADKIRKKLSKARVGFVFSKETRQKMRETKLKYIERMGGGPSVNESTLPFLKEFDEINKTKGLYGRNEHRTLGYSLDYFNKDLKIIIEVDEGQHFDKEGNLKEKDKQRQKEIQEYYPDFKFLRFRDIEMDKILKINL